MATTADIPAASKGRGRPFKDTNPWSRRLLIGRTAGIENNGADTAPGRERVERIPGHGFAMLRKVVFKDKISASKLFSGIGSARALIVAMPVEVHEAVWIIA